MAAEPKFNNEPITPCQKILLGGVQVVVKREDLNHPVVQGNKLRKLKYNLLAAQASGCDGLLTFGGAYSNHLLATAYAARQSNLKAIGVVRGDELANNQARWSETLYQCHQLGMELLFVSRVDYRLKEQAKLVSSMRAKHRQMFIIPEGGSNQYALQGMAELVAELEPQTSQPTHIFCPVGTGGTLAGLVHGVADSPWACKVVGVGVLKSLQAVKNDIEQWVVGIRNTPKWSLEDKYHTGGYAKSTPELARFGLTFQQQHGIHLDRIYNGKSFYALAQMIQQGLITDQDKPLIIHTGGLQGGFF